MILLRNPLTRGFLAIALTTTLCGCVDLTGSRTSYKKQIPNAHKSHTAILKKQKYHGEVHTMRGGLGIFSIGMNQLRDTTASEFQISSYSTMWYNAGDVTRFIVNRYYEKKDHSPVILVGHSLGANEQIKVARNLNDVGIPVALLVTVDAVSQTIVPPNVQHALNLYKVGYVPMFSGLKLRAVNSKSTYVENINVDTLKEVKVNHFTIDKDKVVQAIILDRIKKVLSNDSKES